MSLYIDKGYMDADEDVIFFRHADACNCFGHAYKQYQRALARHAVEQDCSIWFPKLFDDGNWDNHLSLDEEIIYERNKHDNDKYIRTALNQPIWCFKRVVFVKEKERGKAIYRFKGLYEVDLETTLKTSIMTYRRKAKRVTTYPPVE